MAFQVINVIDGDTIRVSPNWVLGEKKGDIVKVRGYSTPHEKNQNFATKKLKNLLFKKTVELKSAEVFNTESEAIICNVFLNGVNIATYFPEFRG